MLHLCYSKENKEEFMEIIHIKDDYKDYKNELEVVLEEVFEKKPQSIGVDCGQIFHINSLLIGTFVKFLHKADQLKIKFILYGVNNGVYSIIEKCGLHKYFIIMSKKEFEKEYGK
jgi:anti-anti-sigma factor